MKKLVSLLVSLGLLALIYWKIDLRKLLPVFAASDPVWMAISLAMVIPLTMLTAWRFQRLVPAEGRIGFGEANRLILSASVLNLVLPSKMGDIAKAFFMPGLRRSLALSLVVFEKACDMLSLLFWCVFGLVWVRLEGGTPMQAFRPQSWFEQLQIANPLPAWLDENVVYWGCFAFVAGCLALGVLLLGSQRFAGFFFGLGQRFAPGKMKGKFEKLAGSWNEMHGYFWGSKARLLQVTTMSVFIWLLHLLQIWFFIFALRAGCPFLANLALSPLAILAGLAPLTFAGVGTRDFALVLLYAAYFDAATAAALGLLCTARYILPAIGGIPFFQRYLAALRRQPPPRRRRSRNDIRLRHLARSLRMASLLRVLPLLALFLPGCASVSVKDVGQNDPAADRPAQLLVAPFSIEGAQVKENPNRKAPGRLGAEAQQLLAGYLVTELNQLGIPTKLVASGAPVPRNAWLVTGRITRLADGNRLLRMAIGLGSGGTKFETQVEVRSGAKGASLMSFATTGGSNAMPGGVTNPVPFSGVPTAILNSKEGITDDSARTARMIAGTVGARLAERGWIEASKVPRVKRASQ